MGEALSRILDPSALDACDKPRGRLVIEVPAHFAGAEIDIVLPPRVTCARCDGGGCDGCGRRGGHRLSGEPEARVVRVTLPLALEGGALLRIVRPLEGEAAIHQLLVEARLAENASPSVTLRSLALPERRDEPREPLPAPSTRMLGFVAVLLFTVAVGLVLFALLR